VQGLHNVHLAVLTGHWPGGARSASGRRSPSRVWAGPRQEIGPDKLATLGEGRRFPACPNLRLVRVSTGALDVLFLTLNRRNTSS
jgi:hypothetical protein